MKKLSVLILCVLLGSAIYAQGVKYGVTGGLNLSTLTENAGDFEGEDTYGNKMKPGFYVGLFAEMPLAGSSMISLRPELYYSQLGSKFESGNEDLEFTQNLDAIELPVLFKVNLIPGFHVLAGPSFSYLLGGKYKGDYEPLGLSTENDIDMDDYNRANIGGVVGLGFGMDRLSISGKYNIGFTDIYKSDNAEAHNSTIQIGLGYSF